MSYCTKEFIVSVKTPLLPCTKYRRVHLWFRKERKKALMSKHNMKRGEEDEEERRNRRRRRN